MGSAVKVPRKRGKYTTLAGAWMPSNNANPSLGGMKGAQTRRRKAKGAPKISLAKISALPIVDGEPEKERPDLSMTRCVLDGYLECAAKVSEACICAQMPREMYEAKYRRKYGPDT